MLDTRLASTVWGSADSTVRHGSHPQSSDRPLTASPEAPTKPATAPVEAPGRPADAPSPGESSPDDDLDDELERIIREIPDPTPQPGGE